MMTRCARVRVCDCVHVCVFPLRVHVPGCQACNSRGFPHCPVATLWNTLPDALVAKVSMDDMIAALTLLSLGLHRTVRFVVEIFLGRVYLG